MRVRLAASEQSGGPGQGAGSALGPKPAKFGACARQAALLVAARRLREALKTVMLLKVWPNDQREAQWADTLGVLAAALRRTAKWSVIAEEAGEDCARFLADVGACSMGQAGRFATGLLWMGRLQRLADRAGTRLPGSG